MVIRTPSSLGITKLHKAGEISNADLNSFSEILDPLSNKAYSEKKTQIVKLDERRNAHLLSFPRRKQTLS